MKQSYSFEVKSALATVRCGRVSVRVGRRDRAASSRHCPRYRIQGEKDLRPEPRGQPAKIPDETLELIEVERLLREVEYLQGENLAGKIAELEGTRTWLRATASVILNAEHALNDPLRGRGLGEADMYHQGQARCGGSAYEVQGRDPASVQPVQAPLRASR